MPSKRERSIRARMVVLLAAVPLVLASACGATGGTSEASDPTTSSTTEATTTTVAESETVDVEVWAEDFCTSFSGWLDGIKTASDEVGDGVTPGDIESGKTAIADLFGEASSGTQSLIADLKEAGHPDITDGDMLSEDLITRFESFDEAALAAQADAMALSVSDSDEFRAAAEELTDRFQSEVSVVADSFSQIDVDYPSRELTLAMNSSCDF